MSEHLRGTDIDMLAERVDFYADVLDRTETTRRRDVAAMLGMAISDYYTANQLIEDGELINRGGC